MNNKIEGLSAPLARPSTASSSKPGQASQASGGAAPSVSEDSVSLSDTASDLASVTRQLAAAPAVDSARVASVRSALESGSYQIDAQEIARRLLQQEAELGR